MTADTAELNDYEQGLLDALTELAQWHRDHGRQFIRAAEAARYIRDGGRTDVIGDRLTHLVEALGPMPAGLDAAVASVRTAVQAGER